MKRLHIRFDPTDIVAAVGLGLLTAGAGMVFIPAAFITCGVLLLAYAVAASRRESSTETETLP
jgi:hypothetical protein